MQTKIKIFMTLLIVSFSTVLSSCTSLNSQFDCPMKPGVMCKSLDQVNTMVDQGAIGSSTTSTCKTCRSSFNPNAVSGNFSTPYPTLAMNPGDPVRYAETVMRIWVAPYEDSEGNYYQPNLLYTVVRPGHWIGNPVKAISDDGDNS